MAYTAVKSKGNPYPKGRLPHDDGMLFHSVMPQLLWYVNKRQNICKTIKTVADVRAAGLDMNFRMLRRQLYTDLPYILDEYLTEDPLKASQEQLNAAKNWKYFKGGVFLVYKYLQNGKTILIGPLSEEVLPSDLENSKAYEVAGVTDAIPTFLGQRPLPLAIRTVVMPFQGTVIIDGIIEGTLAHRPDFQKLLDDFYKKSVADGTVETKIELTPANECSVFKGMLTGMQAARITPEEMKKGHSVYYMTWNRPASINDPNYMQGYKSSVTVFETCLPSLPCPCSYSGKKFGECCQLKSPEDKPILCPTPPETLEEAKTQRKAPLEIHNVTFAVMNVDKLVSVLNSTPFFKFQGSNFWVWVHDIELKVDGTAGVLSYGNLELFPAEKKLRGNFLSRKRVYILLQIFLGLNAEYNGLLANPKIRHVESAFEAGSKRKQLTPAVSSS